MALKFLNKKGWHTGSLRNIENVWKAEQKHEAEQRKLDELRKQIQEERERSEFRLLQQQAGLLPKQERLDFLYESGLAVGKGSSDGFKALQAPPGPAAEASSSSSKPQSAVPGALFEDKPQSANDAWRKLHSDPLLLIRQREQDALARIKNNPIKMAMIKKSVEAEKKKKHEKKDKDEENRHKKHRQSKPNNAKSNTSDSKDAGEGEERRKREHPSTNRKHEKHSRNYLDAEDAEKRKSGYPMPKHNHHSHKDRSDAGVTDDEGKSDEERRKTHHSKNESRYRRVEKGRTNDARSERHYYTSEFGPENKSKQEPSSNRRRGVHNMSEEERVARLRQMELDAELHEEQRWKRVKKASEADAREATTMSSLKGRNFLDDAQKSIYGTEKGGSSTIEESVRRRAYYSQGSSAAHESNAFRR